MSIEGRAGNERGKETEERVVRVLSSLPYIEEVIFTPPETPIKDLTVFFKATDGEIIEPVDIQVKSNLKHLSAAELDLDSSTMGRRREVYFAQQRLILIYAHQKKTDEQIITNFSEKLQMVMDFAGPPFDYQAPRLQRMVANEKQAY
jgi:hypothetical protein